MAKKASKKGGKATSKKTPAKSKVAAAKRKATMKVVSTPKFVAGGPFPVSTGSGPRVSEIAKGFMELVRLGDEMSIYKHLMQDNVVSCEGVGAEFEWRGRNATVAKGEVWMKENKIHGARSEGPYIGATGFSVKFEMDVENLKTGVRRPMTEIGVYTVRDGKIVREEFMYLGD